MAILGNDLAAAQAFTRFGLGGRPDDVLPSDPVGWLTGQLSGPDPAPTAGMMTTAQCMTLLANWGAAKQGSAQKASLQNSIASLFQTEVKSFLNYAVATKVPFRERLVWFWANHFAIMASNVPTMALAGAFVREAIRPHVNGTFQDMLLAVFQHPAMIYNLNNEQSAGPDSQAAINHAKHKLAPLGINENLGRECLELHTVGVSAPYTQADVDAMAMILTGWSATTTQKPYGFIFNSAWHEPTPQVLMGTTFPGSFAGGISALEFLATHPDTYAHLAAQLVTHFVSDTPSAADIATVAQALSSTGGNLTAAATALVNLQSAWVPLQKYRVPQDFVIAVLRGIGAGAPTSTTNDPSMVLPAMGEPTFQPPFPNGWSDLAADWMGPEPMLLRTDWAAALAGTLSLDAVTLAGSTLGPLLGQATLAAIDAASTPQQKLTLLFCSPEFQRR